MYLTTPKPKPPPDHDCLLDIQDDQQHFQTHSIRLHSARERNDC